MLGRRYDARPRSRVKSMTSRVAHALPARNPVPRQVLTSSDHPLSSRDLERLAEPGGPGARRGKPDED